MSFCLLMLLALLLELLVGWPGWLYARIKHPVVWMGQLITWMDNGLNNAGKSHRSRQLAGAVTTLTVVAVSTGVACVVSYCLPDNALGYLVEIMVVSSLFATRSLYEHVNAVAIPLSAGNVSDARTALSHIVGRDTNSLEEPGIAGAAIESLAENASDGVFAPLFWGLLLGLPGVAAYKAINTLDSMIGHRNETYRAFGVVAARLDDAANVIPSRLSAVLIAVAGACVHRMAAVASDAKTHRSPNAGWPEGAMAYALNIRLSGPRTYQNTVSDEPWLNASAALPQVVDLQRGLRIYGAAIGLTLLLLVVCVAVPLVLV
ncbi:MAG: adenosylcobinamide-phosphate synthase CbiB [Granulosicoccus sp.]